jgi:delta 1-pyrroline-5-carboxylate dehydrogenase
VTLAPFANEPTLELRSAANRNALHDALVALDARLPLGVPALIGNDRGSAEGFQSCDPGTPDRQVAHAGVAAATDVNAAVEVAVAAAPAWAALPPAERARILVRAAAI